MNKAIVELGDLRTEMESVKWDNMRKSVGKWYLFVYVRVRTTQFYAISCPVCFPPRHITYHGVPTISQITSQPKESISSTRD